MPARDSVILECHYTVADGDRVLRAATASFKPPNGMVEVICRLGTDERPRGPIWTSGAFADMRADLEVAMMATLGGFWPLAAKVMAHFRADPDGAPLSGDGLSVRLRSGLPLPGSVASRCGGHLIFESGPLGQLSRIWIDSTPGSEPRAAKVDPVIGADDLRFARAARLAGRLLADSAWFLIEGLPQSLGNPGQA